jgi:hypothetical protein
MDKQPNETTSLESEDSGTDDGVKLTLIKGVGMPTVDPKSEAQYERLMRAWRSRRAQRRRLRRLIAYALSAASAVLGFFAMRRFLSR